MDYRLTSKCLNYSISGRKKNVTVILSLAKIKKIHQNVKNENSSKLNIYIINTLQLKSIKHFKKFFKRYS